MSLLHQMRTQHEFRTMGPDFPAPCLIWLKSHETGGFGSFHKTYMNIFRVYSTVVFQNFAHMVGSK